MKRQRMKPGSRRLVLQIAGTGSRLLIRSSLVSTPEHIVTFVRMPSPGRAVNRDIDRSAIVANLPSNAPAKISAAPGIFESPGRLQLAHPVRHSSCEIGKERNLDRGKTRDEYPAGCV
jgi:hypothetical protein